MRRHTQNIEDCEHCGKVFENGEDYWKDARNKCYCVDNACGWEDDETNDEALHIANVVVPKGTLCRCECEMPDIDGRQGLCGRCERPIIA